YLAAPDKRTYSYEYTVHYRGTSDTMTVQGQDDGTVLVLDADRLGVLRVELEIGLVDATRIKSTIVRLWYGEGVKKHEQEFVLDANRPKDVWVEVIAQPVTEPYHYQVTFVDINNQRIPQDLQTSRARKLLVDQPVSEDLQITVVSAGAFGADGLLSKVLV